jgi:hypothetical protein
MRAEIPSIVVDSLCNFYLLAFIHIKGVDHL